jgi:hypothetical protein
MADHSSTAPAIIETGRLRLRRPRTGDAETIYSRYASDPDVTRYLAWPRHTSLDDTHEFLAFSDDEWARYPAGPYLIEDPGGHLLGSTGLTCEPGREAQTGYVLAKDAWGLGYATESLEAMVDLAGSRSRSPVCVLPHRARGLVACPREVRARSRSPARAAPGLPESRGRRAGRRVSLRNRSTLGCSARGRPPRSGRLPPAG